MTDVVIILIALAMIIICAYLAVSAINLGGFRIIQIKSIILRLIKTSIKAKKKKEQIVQSEFMTVGERGPEYVNKVEYICKKIREKMNEPTDSLGNM